MVLLRVLSILLVICEGVSAQAPAFKDVAREVGLTRCGYSMVEIWLKLGYNLIRPFRNP